MNDLVTQRIKIKDMYPDINIKELGYNIDEESIFIKKGLTPEDTKFEDGERAIISYINTLCLDRDNEVLLPKGALLEDYKKNPVVLFCHEHSNLPIGKNIWIKTDSKGLIAKTQYAKHEEADKIYQYRKDGFPLAESVGFIPLEHKSEGDTGWDKCIDDWIKDYENAYGKKPEDTVISHINRIYSKWLLLEYSDVPVPSNPEALQVAISKGIITNKITITKPGWDETDTSFRYRVREPDLFQDGTFRNIPIKEDKPRVNSIMGKLKGENTMTLQSLIFPKEDEWTLNKAKMWLKEHPDIVKECEYINKLDELNKKAGQYENKISSLESELKEIKEGRVLSEKNRKLISNCITQMSEAIELLNELFKATEPVEQEDIIIIDNETDIDIGKIQNMNNDNIELTKDEIKEIIKPYIFELINKKEEDENNKIMEISDTIIKKLKGKVS